LHGGYSRYFTPPPLETVPAGDITQFAGTTGASAVTGPYNTVRAERANYYDLGVSQKVLPGLTLGVDGYYKTAQNQLDDGFFGQSLILSSLNYKRGRCGGWNSRPITTRAVSPPMPTWAYSVAQGEGADSASTFGGQCDRAIRQYSLDLPRPRPTRDRFVRRRLLLERTRPLEHAGFFRCIYGSGLRQDGDIF